MHFRARYKSRSHSPTTAMQPPLGWKAAAAEQHAAMVHNRLGLEEESPTSTWNCRGNLGRQKVVTQCGKMTGVPTQTRLRDVSCITSVPNPQECEQ